MQLAVINFVRRFRIQISYDDVVKTFLYLCVTLPIYAALPNL